MSWEIVLGIITLFGFVVSIVTPILKLTKVMTELIMSVDGLKNMFNQMSTRNEEKFKRIWEQINEQDDKLNDHEKRITKTEYDIDKYHHHS